MRSAQLYAPFDLRLDDIELPKIEPTEVTVEVAFCGVCGTDLHAWTGKSAGRETLPLNLGHEVSGIVDEVGSAVEHISVGARVTVNPYSYCGRCQYCMSGLPNFCTDRSFMRNGWADRLRIPGHMAHAIPDDMTLEVASLAEPLGACMQAIDVAKMQSGSIAVILGGGPIGLGVLALARESGAALTVVSEPSAVRRKIAIRMGATHVVDPTTEDLRDVVMSVTGGHGANVVFDCVTSSATTASALALLRPTGTVVIVGNVDPTDRLSLDLSDVHRRQIAILGTFSRGFVFPRTVNWLKRIDFTPLITDTVGLDEVARALHLAKDGQAGKVLVTPRVQ